jgi:uncharacterized membrane protein YjjP (DUF1212 family)
MRNRWLQMFAAWYVCIVIQALLAGQWQEFSMEFLAHAFQLKCGVGVAFGELILTPTSISYVKWHRKKYCSLGEVL